MSRSPENMPSPANRGLGSKERVRLVAPGRIGRRSVANSRTRSEFACVRLQAVSPARQCHFGIEARGHGGAVRLLLQGGDDQIGAFVSGELRGVQKEIIVPWVGGISQKMQAD